MSCEALARFLPCGLHRLGPQSARERHQPHEHEWPDQGDEQRGQPPSAQAQRLENPTVTVLEKIAAALGVEIAALFADPGPDGDTPPSLPAGRKRRSAK